MSLYTWCNACAYPSAVYVAVCVCGERRVVLMNCVKIRSEQTTQARAHTHTHTNTQLKSAQTIEDQPCQRQLQLLRVREGGTGDRIREGKGGREGARRDGEEARETERGGFAEGARPQVSGSTFNWWCQSGL